MTRTLPVPTKASMIALAVALAAGPSPAAAQSFQGSVDSATGATVDQSTPGQTNVSVTQQQAVINWTATNNPADGTIVFQPDGTVATFSSATDFAVLNRVEPGTAGSAIYLGGTIQSLAGDVPGGTVFFYSPNGIVIGQNASINVGSLGLTTLPIADDGQGNWMSGFGTSTPQVTFGQTTNPNSFVRTSAMIDGSINAFGLGSYVAMVAPIVQHSGVIRTDGAAALVAAEAATITFSPDGLFNIQVSVGTDAATGIDVDGGTIERLNPQEGVGNHHAYLVAVAKNDAVDMLIRGGASIGFDTATSAAVEDNVVVLSGSNVFGGTSFIPNSSNPVNLRIDSSTFSSDVRAFIPFGFADIRTSSGNTSFGSGATTTSLNLLAGEDSIITATNGNTLSFAGHLSANLSNEGTAISPTGGTLRLTANGTGSALSIGGNVILTSRVFGVGEDESGVDAADVTGGTVIVQNGAGSTIDIAGSLGINVDAFGGSVAGGGAAAGSATGGTAQIVANGGSGAGLTVTGPVSISASAIGGSVGSDCSADCGVTGGNGTGGNILLQASTISGSQLDLQDTVDLTASGEGGSGDDAAGSGAGGNVQLVSNDAGAITVVGNLTADASGHGGFGMESSDGGGNGGNANGGLVQIIFQGAPSSIDLQGTSLFSADAFGGDGYGVGGSATGGFVNLQPRFGGSLTADFIGASADASGGSSDIFDTGSGAAGGAATGGRAWLQIDSGGTATVTDLSLSANGTGGRSESGAGGAGTGGYVIASANNGALTVSATTDLEALGRGGLSSDGAGVGGLGTGGQADIFASNNGTVTLGGLVSADTTGRGGNYFSDGATGGNGVGGIVFFQASAGATLTADSDVDLAADGIGGFSFGDCSLCGGTGGDGTGGTVTIQAFGGATTQLTVDGQVDANAMGRGSAGFAGPGGDGQGGTVRLGIQGGAGASFNSDLFLDATGNGGGQTNGGVAGNGTGGLVDAFVEATGGTLTVAGFTEFDASGFGGHTEGSGGIAGDGLGGTARLLALGGAAEFDLDLSVQATGQGGNGGLEVETGTGGDGTGRNAQIQAAGGDIDIGGSAYVNASGFGGAGTTGGSGTGGGSIATFTPGALIHAQNGDIDIGFAAFVDSDGIGGHGTSGPGGVGTGGWAGINANNGSTIDVLGTIESGTFISADGLGGSSVAAAGGNAFGGTATAVGSGGTLHLFGDLVASAEATGGNGTSGGNAVGRITPPAQEESTPALTLFANNGGTVLVDGTSSLSTRATGGGGTTGAGGNAQGGEIDVVAGAGTITLGPLLAVADALGGFGGIGQAGGNAVGGNIDIGWTLTGSILGTIRATDVLLSANGEGGAGGAGADGNSGTNGGAGGSGTGGEIFAVGSAAGGTMNLGDTVAMAQGVGGAGGNGGNGDTGAAGNGGSGGAGEGGFVQMGTVSSDAFAISGGGASYGAVTAHASAVGGAGGNGGTAGGGNGSGGDGGAATGGTTLFFGRGVTVIADTISLLANATGGDGGTGLAAGNGGNAATGFIGVESKDRVNFPDERGMLTADLITGQAIAVGGTGAVNGSSTLRGGNLFRLLNGDAQIGSVSLLFAGTLYDGTDGPDLISVRDGTATITGSFEYSTTGELALDASNGAMNAGSIVLTAETFVPDNFNPPPTITGAYSANSFDISTGGDFVTNANLISTSTLVIDAPGLIDMADATTDGDLLLTAGSTIGGGTQTAAGFVDVNAPGDITLGNVVAGDSIDIISTGGNLSLGSLSAANFIYLEAAANIGFGDATADDFDFDAGGDVSGGDIIAGTLATGEAGGAVTLGDINVGILQSGGAAEDGFAVGIVSATSISVGNVEADEAIGFATFGDLTAGDLNSGTGVMTLIGGDTTIGSITTPSGGRVYHGDAQMFVDAGGLVDDFRPDEVLAQPPIQSGGSYTVSGAISTGQLQAATASISTGDIDARDSATLDAVGSVSTGAIDTGLLDVVAGTDITTGAIDAADGVLLTANNGTISIGTSTAGTNFQAFAGTNLTTRGISAIEIDAAAGGTAAIDGAWSADYVQLVSNDIDITANASISAGEIDLISSNATQTVVGDGVTGSGYQLSDAEYDRLGSGDIDVIADVGRGAAPRILIGDLSVDASGGGGFSEYEFVTFDSQNEIDDIVGSIRVVGEAVFTGLGAEDGVAFTTNLFELDAATGLLSLENAPGTFGGILYLDAAHIHVASGDILDRLAEDPQYDGYQEELNAPAEVQRPGGVVRAASMEIEFEDGGQAELNTLYVQNSGTEDTPAGFVVSEAVFFGEGNEVTPPAGSIDLIINGQIVTQGGTLTGIDVRDALVEAEGDLSPFTANSTINGCLLTGSCEGGGGGGGPFPPGFTPTPGIQDEIELIDDGLLPPPEFGNEDFIDDNIETTIDGATSPIAPPTPLFDTSALGGKSDVDDPVSGSGNPALMEQTPAGDAACPAGGSQAAGQCKQEQQP